jgi:diguanylate cyclase (GGDEF)-like protein/PAS domain S-box-containing protein
MSELSHQENLMTGAALCEAIFLLQGPALEEKVNALLDSVFEGAQLRICSNYLKTESNRALKYALSSNVLVRPINKELVFILSGKNGHYNEQDLHQLNMLTALTARLLNAKLQFHQSIHHSLHAQILDQIHDSIITMDLAGFILSWNRGAEKLFGCSANDVIGKNIIFLYEDLIDVSVDFFKEPDGREIEVRRRKENGAIFWVRLSLSRLYDEQGLAIGMIGYLTDITERKSSEEKINHLAYYDALTDLPNRIFFKKILDAHLQQYQFKNVDKSEQIAVLFIDLNRFKPINDSLGHQLGDVVLKQVAERFRMALYEKDVLARLTGDEFAVAVVDVKKHFNITLLAEKLLASLAHPFLIDGHELSLGASIGISLFPQDGMDAEQLLQTADVAMFKAKRLLDRENGSYLFYSAEMNRSIANRLQLEAAMRRALQNQEFFLLYQAKVCVVSGAITGVEALIRWQRTPEQITPPSEFIQMAEESDLILQIDALVMDLACSQARRWQEMGIKPFRIAVNVSAKEFTSALAQRVNLALIRHQISPEWLELEITESMLMHSADAVVTIMRQITSLGVSLALDDFGTGFSSFSYLKRFPIATLKIDRSFIQGIPDAADDCAIAGAIISMAHQLKHKVIAEGVETREQFDFLRSHGCDEVQGYFFSKPISACAFTERLLTQPTFSLPMNE